VLCSNLDRLSRLRDGGEGRVSWFFRQMRNSNWIRARSPPSKSFSVHQSSHHLTLWSLDNDSVAKYLTANSLPLSSPFCLPSCPLSSSPVLYVLLMMFLLCVILAVQTVPLYTLRGSTFVTCIASRCIVPCLSILYSKVPLLSEKLTRHAALPWRKDSDLNAAQLVRQQDARVQHGSGDQSRPS
jgi:hypothetical protein